MDNVGKKITKQEIRAFCRGKWGKGWRNTDKDARLQIAKRELLEARREEVAGGNN